MLSMICCALFSVTVSAPDGTLVFLENTNDLVERVTDSSITHVGIVLNQDGVSWIYEATPPEVRKIRLDDYYAEIREKNARRRLNNKIRVWVMTPERSFSAEEVAEMQKLLNSYLGRKYSVSGYLVGKPRRGLHCSELVANALMSVKKLPNVNAGRTTPVELMDLARKAYRDRLRSSE